MDNFKIEQIPYMLTVKMVSGMLNIGLNRTYELFRSPEFPSMKIGHTYMIRRDKLFEFFEIQEKKIS